MVGPGRFLQKDVLRLNLAAHLDGPATNSDARQEFAGGKGFGEVIIRPGIEPLDKMLGVCILRHKHDVCVGVARGADVTAEFWTGQSRHQPVGDQDFGLKLDELTQRLGAVFDETQLVRLACKDDLKEFSAHGRIFSDEHASSDLWANTHRIQGSRLPTGQNKTGQFNIENCAFCQNGTNVLVCLMSQHGTLHLPGPSRTAAASLPLNVQLARSKCRI
jgi:hypothetical protein